MSDWTMENIQVSSSTHLTCCRQTHQYYPPPVRKYTLCEIFNDFLASVDNDNFTDCMHGSLANRQTATYYYRVLVSPSM